jgi:hypothetical protein
VRAILAVPATVPVFMAEVETSASEVRAREPMDFGGVLLSGHDCLQTAIPQIKARCA